MPTQKIRLDLELDTAEALFELIADVIKSKRTKIRDVPLNKISLAMLGVELADKLHGHRLIERMAIGIPEPPIDPRD